MSKVEDEVCELIQARAKKATIVEKYDGATMERDDLSHDEWLEHLQHELMDAVIYVQRLRTREQTLEAKLRKCIEFYRGRTTVVKCDSVARSLEEVLIIRVRDLLDEVSE